MLRVATMLLLCTALPGCSDDVVLATCGAPKPPTATTCGDGVKHPGELCLGSTPHEFELEYTRDRQLGAGDFDQDGHRDLLAGKFVHAGDGAGGWTELDMHVPTPWDRSALAIGDLDGDGFDDVAVAYYFANCFPYDPTQGSDYGRIEVRFGGDPPDPARNLLLDLKYSHYPSELVLIPASSDGPGFIAYHYVACDVDSGAGKLLRWSPDDDALTEQALPDSAGSGDYWGLEVGDVDNDGRVDANFANAAYLNRGGGLLEKLEGPTDLPWGDAQFGHDLDCDGQPDAVDLVADYPDGTYTLNAVAWRGLDGTYTEQPEVLIPAVRDLQLADLNADGEADLLACTADGLLARFGTDDLAFGDPVTLFGQPCREFIAADFNEDGADDLAIAPVAEPNEERALVFLSAR